MQQGYFITGTDTDVGKTWATISLIHYFKIHGYSVIGMKPVAAGCSLQDGQMKNADAVLMQAHSNVSISYDLINPYAYPMPVSPHIAGIDNPVKFEKILANFAVLADQAEVVLVEGAGGWFSPLNNQQDNSELANALNLPVILVVGIRLGCINQAKLTNFAIQQSGLHCAGWIAMCIDPKLPFIDENIQTIQAAIDLPLLGIIPFDSNADFANMAECISFGDLKTLAI